jgi:hypothetical protein
MIRGSTKREHNHIAMSAAARLASALDARLAKATAMASRRARCASTCELRKRKSDAFCLG